MNFHGWNLAPLALFLVMTPDASRGARPSCSDVVNKYSKDFLTDKEDETQKAAIRLERRRILGNIRFCLTADNGASPPEVDLAMTFVRSMGWDLLNQSLMEPSFLKWPGPDLSPALAQRSFLLQRKQDKDVGEIPETFQTIHMNLAAAEAFHRLKDNALLAWQTGEPNLFPNFPQTARVIKAIWRRVPAGGYLQLGIWPGEAAITAPEMQQKSNDWKDCVVVYQADGPPPATSVCAGGAKAQVASTDEFTHYTVTEPTAIAVSFLSRADRANFGLGRGDTLILVGLHLASKEIPDWTWSTFWWQPVRTQIGDLKQFSKDKPQNLQDDRIWKNFVGNSSISFLYPESPRTPENKRYNVIFNPYLEATELMYGTLSNCMSCHSRASTSGAISRGVVRDVPGLETVKDFEGEMKTDYSWSLAIRVKYPPPSQPPQP